MLFAEDHEGRNTTDTLELLSNVYSHPCNKSPSAIAVTIVAAIAVAIAVPRAAAIAGVRAYESVPLYAVPL